jgi:hypothetical protein
MWRNRKLRLAIVIGVALVAIYVAWRMEQARQPEREPCVPGRQVETDASGKVVSITNRICKDQK